MGREFYRKQKPGKPATKALDSAANKMVEAAPKKKKAARGKKKSK